MERLREIGRSALACEDAWQGLVQFMENCVEMMTTDRGLWTLAIGGVSKSRNLELGRENYWQVVPQLLAHAQASGQLRPDLRPEDMSVFSMMLGTASIFTGHESPEAWRRYMTLLLDGMRADGPVTPLPVPELSSDELDRAMSAWYPTRHASSSRRAATTTAASN